MSKNLNNRKPKNTPHILYDENIGRKQNGIAANSSRIIQPGSRNLKARSAVSQMPTAKYASNVANITYRQKPIPSKSKAYSNIPATLPHVPGALSSPNFQSVAHFTENPCGNATAQGYNFFLIIINVLLGLS